MKLKKLIPAAMAGLLLFAGCNFDGNNIDYNQNSSLSAVSDGTTPGVYPSAEVAVSGSLKAAAESDFKIVIKSKAEIKEETISSALKFYSLKNNEDNPTYYPAKVDTLSYVLDRAIEKKNGEKDYTTTVTGKINLKDITCNKVEWILDAAELKYSNGDAVLNGNGNEKGGEETDSITGYVSVNTELITEPVVITNTYTESFAPVYSYYYSSSFIDQTDETTGATKQYLKIKVYDISFNGEDYIKADAADIAKIISLSVKTARSNRYSNVNLTFEYDETNHVYTAKSDVYETGTKILIVTKHDKAFTTNLTDKICGHSAALSWFNKAYNTYSKEYVLGYIDPDEKTILSVNTYSTPDDADPVFAQNEILDVEKNYSYVTDSVKAGVSWIVGFNSDYSSVASVFDKISGFVVISEAGVVIPSSIIVEDTNEENDAVKVRVIVDNKYLDGTKLNLWVNENVTLKENGTNENQLNFGDSTNTAAGNTNSKVKLIEDSITGLANSATRYSLTAEYDKTTNSIKLEFVLENGKGKRLYIYRNNYSLADTKKSVYTDTSIQTGTTYTYRLYDEDGNSISDAVRVEIPAKSEGALYTLTVTDNTNYTGSYYYKDSSYLYISISHINGCVTKKWYLYRTDKSDYLTSGTSSSTSYADYDIYAAKSYTYVLKDENGKEISDPYTVTTKDAGFYFFVRKSSDYSKPFVYEGTNELKVWWALKSNVFGYGSNRYKLVVTKEDKDGNKEPKPYTNDSSSWSTLYDENNNSVYRCWAYKTITLEPGKKYTFALKDNSGADLVEPQVYEIPEQYCNTFEGKFIMDDSGNPYSAFNLEWRTSSADLTTFSVYRKNGENEVLLGTSNENKFVDDTIVAGKEYAYSLKDSNGYPASTTHTVSVPALVKLNVEVYDENNDALISSETIDIHEGNNETLYAGLWQKELYAVLNSSGLAEGYTTENSVVYADSLFLSNATYASIINNGTVYVSKGHNPRINGTVEVGDSFSDELADFKIVSGSVKSTQYYTVELEKGKTYSFDLYNSNIKSNRSSSTNVSYIFKDLDDSEYSSWNNSYIRVYAIAVDGGFQLIYSSNDLPRVKVTAPKTGKYVISIGNNSSGVCAFRVYEDSLLNVILVDENGDETDTYEIPVNAPVYTSSGIDMTTSGHSYSAINTFSSLVEYINSTYNKSYESALYNFYNNAAGTGSNLTKADIVDGAVLYMKKTVLTVNAAPSYNVTTDFVKVDSNACNGSYVKSYEFETEPGKFYTVQFVNGNSNSSSYYSNLPTDVSYSSSANYKIYTSKGKQLDSYIWRSSDYRTVSFLAKDTKYRVYVNNYDVTYTSFIRVSEAAYNVVIEGDEDVELKIPTGRVYVNPDNSNDYSNTVQALKNLLINNSYCTYNYMCFTKSGDSYIKENLSGTLSTSVTYYFRKATLPIDENKADEYSDFTMYAYSDAGSKSYTYGLEVEAGKTYGIEFLNGYSDVYNLYSSFSGSRPSSMSSNDKMSVYYVNDEGEVEYIIQNTYSYGHVSFTAEENYSYFVDVSLYYSDNTCGFHVYEYEPVKVMYGEKEYSIYEGSHRYVKEVNEASSLYTVKSLYNVLQTMEYILNASSDLYSLYKDEGLTELCNKSTAYEPGNTYYLAVNTITVSSGTPELLSDFTVYEYDGKTASHAYKLSTVPGKTYTVQLYNSNSSITSLYEAAATIKTEADEAGLSFRSDASYFVYADPSSSSSSVMNSRSDLNRSFIAAQEEYYIWVDTKTTTSKYAVGVRVIESEGPTVTLINSEDNEVTYTVPKGTVYYKTSSGYTSSDFSSALNYRKFLPEIGGLNYKHCTIYTDEDYSIPNMNTSDILEKYYIKKSVLEVGTSSAAKVSEFDLYSYDICYDYSHYYGLNVEPGETYVIQFLNDSTRDSMGITNDKSYSFYGLAFYSIGKMNGSTLTSYYSGSDGFVTLTVPEDETETEYTIRLYTNSSSSYYTGIHVFKAAGHVYVDGEDKGPVKLGKELSKNSPGSWTLSSSGLINTGDLYKYLGLDIKYYEAYSDEEYTKFLKLSTGLPGNNVYIKKSSIEVSDHAPTTADDFTWFLSDYYISTHNYFTAHYYDLEVEAGKFYSLNAYNNQTACTNEWGTLEGTPEGAKWAEGYVQLLQYKDGKKVAETTASYTPKLTFLAEEGYTYKVWVLSCNGSYTNYCIGCSVNEVVLDADKDSEFVYTAKDGTKTTYTVNMTDSIYSRYPSSPSNILASPMTALREVIERITKLYGVEFNYESLNFYYEDDDHTMQKAYDSDLSTKKKIYFDESYVNVRTEAPAAAEDYVIYSYSDRKSKTHDYKVELESGHKYAIVNYSDGTSSYSDNRDLHINTKYYEQENMSVMRADTTYFIPEQEDFYFTANTYSTGSSKVGFCIYEVESIPECVFTVDCGGIKKDYTVYVKPTMIDKDGVISYYQSGNIIQGASDATELCALVNAYNGTSYSTSTFKAYKDSEYTEALTPAEVAEGGHYYLTDSALNTITVNNGRATKWDDFTVLTNTETKSRTEYYKFTTTPGKLYHIEFYGNTTEFSGITDVPSGLNFSGNKYFTLYDSNTLMFDQYNSGIRRYVFIAEKNSYIIKMSTYSSYKDYSAAINIYTDVNDVEVSYKDYDSTTKTCYIPATRDECLLYKASTTATTYNYDSISGTSLPSYLQTANKYCYPEPMLFTKLYATDQYKTEVPYSALTDGRTVYASFKDGAYRGEMTVFDTETAADSSEYTIVKTKTSSAEHYYYTINIGDGPLTVNFNNAVVTANGYNNLNYTPGIYIYNKYMINQSGSYALNNDNPTISTLEPGSYIVDVYVQSGSSTGGAAALRLYQPAEE